MRKTQRLILTFIVVVLDGEAAPAAPLQGFSISFGESAQPDRRLARTDSPNWRGDPDSTREVVYRRGDYTCIVTYDERLRTISEGAWTRNADPSEAEKFQRYVHALDAYDVRFRESIQRYMCRLEEAERVDDGRSVTFNPPAPPPSPCLCANCKVSNSDIIL